MASYTEYIGYFEDIATNHRAIRHSRSNKHFFRIDLEELIAGLKTKISYPCLVLESYDWRMTDHVSDNILKERNCAFMILMRPKNAGDYDEVSDLFNQAEVIVDDILALMWYHKHNKIHDIIADIDMNTIEVLPVNGFIENAVGYRVSFQTITGHNIALDENKWITTDF